MADSDRIVFPDEAEEIKAKEAANKTSGGDTNEVEVPPPAQIQMRNVVVTPPNCPPGHEMGPDGVCREIWK